MTAIVCFTIFYKLNLNFNAFLNLLNLIYNLIRQPAVKGKALNSFQLISSSEANS